MAEKTKREIVKETVEAGNATMETLIRAADCKYESVMSIFSMLRLMGHCAVKDVPSTEDPDVMTYRFITTEEWEKFKAERVAKSKTTTKKMSPEERYSKALTRVRKADKQRLKTKKRAEDSNDTMSNLRADKAAIEYQIALLEFENAKAEYVPEEVEFEKDETEEEFEVE